MDVPPSSTARKRITTYGRAQKSRAPQHVSNDALFNSPRRTKVVSAYTLAARLPQRTPSKSPTISSGNSTPAKSLSYSAHGDLYDVPLSDGERADKHSPRKRRKVLPIPASVCTERLQQVQGTYAPSVEAKKPATPKMARRRSRSGIPVAKETMTAKTMPYSYGHKDIRERSRLVVNQAMISTHPLQYSGILSTTVNEGVSLLPVEARDHGSMPSSEKVKHIEVPVSPTRSHDLDTANEGNETIKQNLHVPAAKDVTTISQMAGRAPAALNHKLMRLHELLEDVPASTVAHAERRGYVTSYTSPSQRQHGSPRRQRLIDSLDSPSKLTALRLASSQTVDGELAIQLDLRQRLSSPESCDSEADPTISSDNIIVDARVAVQPVVASNTTESEGQSSLLAGSKFTYGQQRTMLVEEDPEKLAFETPFIDIAVAPPQNQKSTLPCSKDTSDMSNEDSHVAIRSLHELRQSGLNSRFADEIEDLFDQIGTPSTSSSLRRAGLLDLTAKLNIKSCYEMSKGLAVEQRLFLHLGQETDVISGFLIMSILWLVLDDCISPASVLQLRKQGIARLIIRQLQYREDVGTIAKNRKTNLSKHSIIALIEQKNRISAKASWGQCHLAELSPCTLALCCLERMVRQCRQAGDANDLISRELMKYLFKLLDLGPMLRGGSYKEADFGIDFRLALSALESHSLKGIAASDEASWVEQNLPILRDTLKVILHPSTMESGDLQVLSLRLTLNVTNNSKHASEIFTAPELLSCLVDGITTNFRKMSQSLFEEEQLATVDHLVLLLGVMINFTEWSAPARQFFSDEENGGPNALSALVHIFTANADMALEADSVKDSHRNVVFGYLSVLLGYICLSLDAARLVRRYLKSCNLQRLVDSIEDFISHHKKVDDMFENDVDGHNSHAGLTSRLQAMMVNLRAVERSAL